MKQIYLLVPAALGFSLYFLSQENKMEAPVIVRTSESSTQQTVAPEVAEEAKPRLAENKVVEETPTLAKEEIVEIQNQDYEHPKLARYSDLNSKALRTESEENERAKLIEDSEFVRDLARAVKPEVKTEDQFEALDLLFDALLGGARGDAVKVLDQVVRDARVEDSNLPLAERKAAGGLKAEVLYRWLAKEPDQRESLAQALPGPVSRQIWDNVLDQQENNLKESEEMDQKQAQL